MVAHRPPRSDQDLQPDEAGRPGHPGAGLRMERLLHRGRRGQGQEDRHLRKHRHAGDRQDLRRYAAGNAQGVGDLSHHRRGRALPVEALRRRRVAVPQPRAGRRPGATAALEAGHQPGQRRTGRGARPRLCRRLLPGRVQGQDGATGRRPAHRAEGAHPEPDLDVRRHQGQGAGKAVALYRQDRLSRQVEGLFQADHQGGQPDGRRRGRFGLRMEPRPGQDRQAGRQERMGHDAADGQRLL